jgi:hypothetical protein
VALIEASLEELPVRAELGQSCLATKISAPGPNILGGSATGGLLHMEREYFVHNIKRRFQGLSTS